MYHLSPLSFGYFSLHLEHTVVLMEKWDAERALQLIDRYRVTDVAMVPTQMHRLMALPEDVRARYDVSSLRQVIHAAAPCPIDLKRRLFEWFGPVIYEFYGASEGGGTLAKPEDWLAHPGTVGRPWVGRRREGARRRRQRGAARHRRHGLPEAHGRVRVQGRSREDRGQPARRLLHRRRHGRARRRGLPLPARPQDRHDRVGRREHLPGRGRGRVAVAPRGRRRRGVRDPARRLGRSGEGGGRAGRPASRRRPSSPTSCSRTARACSARYKLPRSIDFVDAMPRDPNGKLYKRTLRDPYWVGRERAI